MPMSKKTRATEMLEKSGVAFSVHTYDYDPYADSIGLQAAESLGEPPQRVLKTLMALVDGKPVCTDSRCWSIALGKNLPPPLSGCATTRDQDARGSVASGGFNGIGCGGQAQRWSTFGCRRGCSQHPKSNVPRTYVRA
jgi:hypothetical protein